MGLFKGLRKMGSKRLNSLMDKKIYCSQMGLALENILMGELGRLIRMGHAKIHTDKHEC